MSTQPGLVLLYNAVLQGLHKHISRSSLCETSVGFCGRRNLEKKGGTYIFDGTAGFDIVVEGHPLLVVGVLPWAEDVLETLVVGFLIDDPHAALHSDGAAAVEVCVQVSAVAAAVVAATLEFLLIKKCDLWKTYAFNKPKRRKSL